jgi:glycosyltransferase involved in cell wall biosynthesis
MSITAIITFYDEIHLINRCVESVISNLKDMPGAEILICNDGGYSCEDISGALSEIPKVPNIKVINNHHKKGPGGNRNTGIDAASNDFLAFLDADDRWLPGKIKAQFALLLSGCTFVACSYEFQSGVRVSPPGNISTARDIFLKRGLGTSTICVSRRLIGDDRFSDLRYSQDIDFWFRLANKPEFCYSRLEKSFVIYNQLGSTRNKYQQLISFYKVLTKNRITNYDKLAILISYTLNGILNHYIKSEGKKWKL